MKVLLDTSIIMDALQERQPFDADAKKILLKASAKRRDNGGIYRQCRDRHLFSLQQGA